MKMFMYSSYSDARQWYFSLPPSSISSLKDFYKAFTEHGKRYYSIEFAFDNCCEEYKLHSQGERVNREEYLPQELPHLSYDFHNEVLSHKHKLETNYKGVEGFPTIVKSDCGEYEELISLTTHGNDHLSTGQMIIEISQASS